MIQERNVNERVQDAQRAVERYTPDDLSHDEDARAATVDLMADILHLAAARGWDVESLLRIARNHYEAEQN